MCREESEGNENCFWDQFKPRHIAAVVSETALFSLVMVLALFGNLLVCYAVYRNPRLRCPSNYYIISLALTDILQASCTMPLAVVFLATRFWPFGTPVCYVAAITKLSLVITSLYTMTLMALNRYYKIVKPSKYQAIFKKNFIVITASVVWAIAIFVVLLVAFVFGEGAKPSPLHAVCVLQFDEITFPCVSLVFFTPYFIIGFCYCKIYRVVKTHNANVSWQSSNVEDVKVSKTLLATVVGFVCLWLPAHIIYSVSILKGYSYFPRIVSLLATFLGFTTSCVNPFIYGFMNRAFKSEFKKCLFRRKTHSVAAETST